MKTSHALWVWVPAVLLGCGVLPGTGATLEKVTRVKRPNVVLILASGMRADVMGCAGHPFVQTPNLDRLAREGTRFQNAFAVTALGNPSRATLLSGLRPSTHGVRAAKTPWPADLPSFAKVLKESGYETAWIGKASGGDAPRPEFTSWMVSCHPGTETERAVEWIRQAPPSDPFLVVLSLEGPEPPFDPGENLSRLFDGVDIPLPLPELEGKPDWIRERMDTPQGVKGFCRAAGGSRSLADVVRAYWASVKSVDDRVGRIYETLKSAGRLEHTLIVFTSDAGFLLGEHGMVGQRTMHEPSIRVPLLVRHPLLTEQPEGVRASRVVTPMVLTVDLAPSILDLCSAPRLPREDGASWKVLLSGETRGWRKSWVYEYDYDPAFPFVPNVRGIRIRDWKFVRYPSGDGKPDRHRQELYHLKFSGRERENYVDEIAVKEYLILLDVMLESALKGSESVARMPLDQGLKVGGKYP
jgi:N-acetylglucosamine-6-sulfatase